MRIRLLKKDGVIVGAETSGAGEMWLPIDIRDLDTNTVYTMAPPPKRTLAEELKEAWTSQLALREYDWNAVASKAKEVLLGEDKVKAIAEIMTNSPNRVCAAKKILEYLRETN